VAAAEEEHVFIKEFSRETVERKYLFH